MLIKLGCPLTLEPFPLTPASGFIFFAPMLALRRCYCGSSQLLRPSLAIRRAFLALYPLSARVVARVDGESSYHSLGFNDPPRHALKFLKPLAIRRFTQLGRAA